jgi:signal peptidase I
MEPELVPNDFVFITAYDFDDLKEGDIVAFVDPNNNVVVHYFAEWTVNERGDACFRTRPADPEAPMDYWRITKDKFVGDLFRKNSKSWWVLKSSRISNRLNCNCSYWSINLFNCPYF